jgi:hypothetical protein
MTGSVPFSCWHDLKVVSQVTDGARPERPESAEAYGLSDALWKLMEDCWNHRLESRPTANIISERLSEISRYWKPSDSLVSESRSKVAIDEECDAPMEIFDTHTLSELLTPRFSNRLDNTSVTDYSMLLTNVLQIQARPNLRIVDVFLAGDSAHQPLWTVDIFSTQMCPCRLTFVNIDSRRYILCSGQGVY